VAPEQAKMNDVRRALFVRLAAEDEGEEFRRKLGTSPHPENWLIAFEADCIRTVRRKMSYRSLAASLVMMGPGPALEPTLAQEKPRDYDHRVWVMLQSRCLIGKVRRVIREDMKVTDPQDSECGNIVFKPYGQWLLTHFLKHTHPPVGGWDIHTGSCTAGEK